MSKHMPKSGIDRQTQCKTSSKISGVGKVGPQQQEPLADNDHDCSGRRKIYTTRM